MADDALKVRAGYLPDVEGAEVLVFESEGGQTLEIQSGLRADAQDARLGWAGHCVVLDGATSYQGIEAVELDGDVLVLRFTAGSQSEIGIDPVIGLSLDGIEPGEALAIIERMLARDPFAER